MDVELVKFYVYEKGDTNKDKGVRCHDYFGVLAPGLCLTFFLREEMFQVVVGQTHFETTVRLSTGCE